MDIDKTRLIMDAKKYMKDNGINYSTYKGGNGEFLRLRVKGRGWTDIEDILEDYAKCVLSNISGSLPLIDEIEKERLSCQERADKAETDFQRRYWQGHERAYKYAIKKIQRTKDRGG